MDSADDPTSGSGKPGDLARMRGKAIKLLAGREHSEKELLLKLARASARSAQRERSSAQRSVRAAQKKAKAAAETSFENGFDEPDEISTGKIEGFDSKKADFAPQVLGHDSAQTQAATPSISGTESAPVERMSARELAMPAAQNAAAVLESLKADGYQSDRRYAESITRHFAGKMSKSAIAGKLKAAGVARDEIDDAMAQALGDEHRDDFAVAQEIWLSKFRNPPENDKEKAKQVRFLQSRGFSISVALRVIKLAGVPTDEDA